MNRKLRSRGRGRAALIIAACLACPLVSRGGVPVQWDPNPADGLQGGPGTWSTSASNWDADGVRRAWANGNGDTAVFGGAGGGLIGLGTSALTAAALQIDTAGYTIGATTSPVINLSSGSVTANADVTVNAPLSTTVPLVKSGAGTLTLLGNNTIRTSLTITAGLVSFNAETALGANTNRVDLNGGGLRYAGSSPLSLRSTRSVVVGAAGGTIDTATSLTLANARQLAGAGDLVKTGNQTLTISGDNPDFTGTVTVKAGTLQLAVAGCVNHGVVTLAGGTLLLRGDFDTDLVGGVTASTGDSTLDAGQISPGSPPLVHAVGDVAVNAGATLTVVAHDSHTYTVHDLSVAGGLRIADTGVTVGGTVGGTGTVYFGALGQAVAGGPAGLVLTGGGSRASSVGLTADAGGRATLGLAGGSALAYDGAWTGSAAGAQNAVNLSGGATFTAGANARLNTLADDGASARPFVVTGTGPADTFELGAGFVAEQGGRGGAGAFAGLASLEVRGATLVTRATAGLPLVTRGNGAGGTHRAGLIDFPAAPMAAAWNVAGVDQQYDGGVRIAAPVTIRTDANLTHGGVATGRFDGQFQIPAANVTMWKTGPGTLRLAGSQGYAPGTEIQVTQGGVRFDSDPGAGWYDGNFTRGADGTVTTAPVAARTLAVVVGVGPVPGVAGSSAQFAAPLSRIASLQVNPGGTVRLAGDAPASPTATAAETLVTSALSVATGGAVDLATGRLVIDYDAAAGTPSPFADVLAMIKDGRMTGGQSLPAQRATTVGFAEAADLFRNVPVADRAFGNAAGIDDTAVLARVTFAGDADLDGRVGFTDYQRFQAGYGKPGGHWSVGDFNLDAQVNSADFALFYTNLDRATMTPAEQQAVEAFAGTVPEPGGLVWMAGTLLMMARRRRTRDTTPV